MSYEQFISAKSQSHLDSGFEPTFMPGFLFDFQKELVRWATRKGRAAIFADCGLGKTAMQLTWAQNVAEKTNKPVLILTPLAVAAQTEGEGEKFGIECRVSRDGQTKAKITATNYQKLVKFDWKEFGGVVCDESGILKNYDGQIKSAVVEFMRQIPYRLLCTATAAPNDYIELGNSSEALGGLGFVDVLGKFFKKAEETTSRAEEYRAGLYRFRGHAERDFWRWVCSWARAVRKPSDLGFTDDGYALPPLITNQHVITAREKNADFLFPMPAHGLSEQRSERRRTLTERCEKAAELIIANGGPSVGWCALNPEGDLLEKLVPGAVQVDGKDDDDFKEEAFTAFAAGQINTIISKSTIAGYGLNWQHCAHQTFFPSHSFEQWYQSIRRSWRFGQKRPVTVDVITSEGESRVLQNMQRKATQADQMFAKLVELMNSELKIESAPKTSTSKILPSWL